MHQHALISSIRGSLMVTSPWVAIGSSLCRGGSTSRLEFSIIEVEIVADPTGDAVHTEPLDRPDQGMAQCPAVDDHDRNALGAPAIGEPEGDHRKSAVVYSIHHIHPSSLVGEPRSCLGAVIRRRASDHIL